MTSIRIIISSNYLIVQPIFSDKEFTEVVNPRKLDVTTVSPSINSKIVFKTTQSPLVKTIPPSTVRPTTSAIELITTPATTTKKSKINFPKNDCETLCDEPYNIGLCSNECKMIGRLNTIDRVILIIQSLVEMANSYSYSSKIHSSWHGNVLDVK